MEGNGSGKGNEALSTLARRIVHVWKKRHTRADCSAMTSNNRCAFEVAHVHGLS